MNVDIIDVNRIIGVTITVQDVSVESTSKSVSSFAIHTSRIEVVELGSEEVRSSIALDGLGSRERVGGKEHSLVVLGSAVTSEGTKELLVRIIVLGSNGSTNPMERVVPDDGTIPGQSTSVTKLRLVVVEEVGVEGVLLISDTRAEVGVEIAVSKGQDKVMVAIFGSPEAGNGLVEELVELFEVTGISQTTLDIDSILIGGIADNGELALRVSLVSVLVLDVGDVAVLHRGSKGLLEVVLNETLEPVGEGGVVILSGLTSNDVDASDEAVAHRNFVGFVAERVTLHDGGLHEDGIVDADALNTVLVVVVALLLVLDGIGRNTQEERMLVVLAVRLGVHSDGTDTVDETVERRLGGDLEGHEEVLVIVGINAVVDSLRNGKLTVSTGELDVLREGLSGRNGELLVLLGDKVGTVLDSGISSDRDAEDAVVVEDIVVSAGKALRDLTINSDVEGVSEFVLRSIVAFDFIVVVIHTKTHLDALVAVDLEDGIDLAVVAG